MVHRVRGIRLDRSCGSRANCVEHSQDDRSNRKQREAGNFCRADHCSCCNSDRNGDCDSRSVGERGDRSDNDAPVGNHADCGCHSECGDPGSNGRDADRRFDLRRALA